MYILQRFQKHAGRAILFVKYQPPSDRSPVSLTDEESFKIVSHKSPIVTINAFKNGILSSHWEKSSQLSLIKFNLIKSSHEELVRLVTAWVVFLPETGVGLAHLVAQREKLVKLLAQVLEGNTGRKKWQDRQVVNQGKCLLVGVWFVLRSRVL